MTLDATGMNTLNVLDFGARPNSFEDDTAAFLEALKRQKKNDQTLFVPAGIYFISQPLNLFNTNLCGDGMMATVIMSTCPDPLEPIVYAGRSVSIRDLTLAYKNELISKHERQGERVGIRLHDREQIYGLQRGSALRNIRIEQVGTAIYDPRVGLASHSVTFDTLEIINFSYRAFDFSSGHRIGHLFSNLFLASNMPDVDAVFHFEGEDSTLTLHQITVLQTKCRCVFHLEDVRGLSASTVYIQDVELRQPGDSFLSLVRSSAQLDELAIWFSTFTPTSALIRLGDAGFEHSPHRENALRIGHLQLKGMNDPTDQRKTAPRGVHDYRDKGYLFFDRSAEAEGEYTVEVSDYAWCAYQQDDAFYDEMPRDPCGRIHFIALGRLPLGGSAEQRPVNRLCPYATRYFDTDMGRELIWDGETWR